MACSGYLQLPPPPALDLHAKIGIVNPIPRLWFKIGPPEFETDPTIGFKYEKLNFTFHP